MLAKMQKQASADLQLHISLVRTSMSVTHCEFHWALQTVWCLQSSKALGHLHIGWHSSISVRPGLLLLALTLLLKVMHFACRIFPICQAPMCCHFAHFDNLAFAGPCMQDPSASIAARVTGRIRLRPSSAVTSRYQDSCIVLTMQAPAKHCILTGCHR